MQNSPLCSTEYEDARRVITLLQYLNQTRSHKLVYHRDEHPMRRQLHKYAEKDREFHNYLKPQCEKTIEGNQLIGFTDADYASKLDPDLKSTSGFCFMFRHNVICWKSKLQPILAGSTHEAELIAMNIAAQETIWLRNLMCEINAALTGLDYNTLIDDTPEEDIHETTLYPNAIHSREWAIRSL
jgi:hypothetical protein